MMKERVSAFGGLVEKNIFVDYSVRENLLTGSVVKKIAIIIIILKSTKLSFKLIHLFSIALQL